MDMQLMGIIMVANTDSIWKLLFTALKHMYHSAWHTLCQLCFAKPECFLYSFSVLTLFYHLLLAAMLLFSYTESVFHKQFGSGV